MKRVLRTVAILAASGLLGWVVYRQTDSTTAAYIISCAGTAAAIAALFLDTKKGNGIASSVKVKKAKDANVAGVSYSGASSPPAIKSKVDIGTINGGGATGVKWTQGDDQVKDRNS